MRRLACLLAAVLAVLAVLAVAAVTPAARAEWIWVEGEKPVRHGMHRHPWWYDQVKKELFSGGDFVSNFDKDRPGEAAYEVRAKQAGDYELWVRTNPVQARLSYRLGGGDWQGIALDKGPLGTVNVAADGKPDLRFLAWVKAGTVPLKAGRNTIEFRMDSKNSNHGYLDCFVLSSEPFQPRGLLKPDQVAADDQKIAAANQGWFPFAPRPGGTAALDLRFLNEETAGAGGFIGAKDGHFIHTKTGEPVRFWAVNGPPHGMKDPAELRACARMLARCGVNLVRAHGAVFDDQGRPDLARVKHLQDVVAAMKAEGIYTHLSIWFPLWFKPGPDCPFLLGYDGTKHPFAALYFNPEFQKVYRTWWEALMLTPDGNGRKLIDEPAVFGAEMINEDSYFFWTFAEGTIPDAQLRLVEKQFGDWLAREYGSAAKALAAWGGPRLKRDNPEAGRVAFRPLWNMANERTPRDKDAARFLLASQKGFYEDTYRFLRGLGFRGLLTCSNWTTADPRYLGPLEKYSYTAGDFLDRHGYFGCNHKGEHSAWSVREGHTYADRSALRFDPEEPGKPRLFVHPVMDPKYAGKPSMVSETTFNRPNRYRGEAPLYYAAYGALQDSDAVVHFALDGDRWTVKPNFWVQPWTLMAPTMMGQFPAAAVIYRKGLVAPGALLADVRLKVRDLADLRGTPLPQDAALDELRLKDVPAGEAVVRPTDTIDPLVHYAGRAQVLFGDEAGRSVVQDLSQWIDRRRQVVKGSNGQMALDYGKGVLTIDAPAAQAVSGNLGAAGTTRLKDVTVASGLETGHVAAVSLDGQPLAVSKKILLQVMSEEKPEGWRTEPAGSGGRRITSLGHDPWLVRDLTGTVAFTRPDAAQLRVTPLEHGGQPRGAVGSAGTADRIALSRDVIYYLIAP